MWDDHRMLNGIADWVYALALLLILYGALMLIIRLPVFPIHEVVVTGSIAHTTRDQVLDIVSGRLKGNFFTQDLEQARLAFEKLPWVRHASLRRQWPDRLFVEIEEHVAIARWRDAALVNSFGEVFEAAFGPQLRYHGDDLRGPDVESDDEVLAVLGFVHRLPMRRPER